jgi:hypothetical protein
MLERSIPASSMSFDDMMIDRVMSVRDLGIDVDLRTQSLRTNEPCCSNVLLDLTMQLRQISQPYVILATFDTLHGAHGCSHNVKIARTTSTACNSCSPI